jgi:hypothetical protein
VLALKGEALAHLSACCALSLAAEALGSAAQLQAVARAALLASAAMQDAPAVFRDAPAGPPAPEAAASASAAALLSESCSAAAASRLLGNPGALRRALARINGGAEAAEAVTLMLAEEDVRERTAVESAPVYWPADEAAEKEKDEEAKVAAALARSAEEVKATSEREAEEAKGLVRAVAAAEEAEKNAAFVDAVLADYQHAEVEATPRCTAGRRQHRVAARRLFSIFGKAVSMVAEALTVRVPPFPFIEVE